MRHAVPSFLALVLIACGGGERPASAPPTGPNGYDEAALDHWIRGKYGDYGDVRFLSAATDLNGDRTKEVIVFVGGQMVCGTGGCNVLVLEQGGDGFVERMDASVSRLPVTVLGSETNGWRDLTVAVGGGGVPAGHARLRFDGVRYPGNPTAAPAEPTAATGTILIPEGAEANLFKPAD